MYKKRQRFIEELARKILIETDFYYPNMNVVDVAKKRGLEVKQHSFGDSVSGVLVIKNGEATIGYNTSHHPVRQRFTIAHEIGHFELKHERGGLFVDEHDKQFSIFRRDENSSTGEILQEREANAFAAALLMPKELLEKAIVKLSFDLTTEESESLEQLAKDFGVSIQAMTFRIANLRLL